MIKNIRAGKENYMDLLLIADPSEDMIWKYLRHGDLHVMSIDGEDVCAAVVTVDGKTAEIKNLATKPGHQQKGYGKEMMKYLIGQYADAGEIILGTGSTGIPGLEFYQQRFYTQCGFEVYRTIKNFFVDNYSEPIFEDDGNQCVDMIYMRYTGNAGN